MKIKSFPIFAIIILGAILRFYNLNWGSPFYFHPDERNIASLVTSLSFPLNLDFFTKGVFSYGTFISYIVFFIKLPLSSYLSQIGFPDPFSQSIILLRFISFSSSVLTIFLIFYIGQKFWSLRIGILASVFTAFSTGLIQASHFGTFESFLTLTYLVIFLFSLLFTKKGKFLYFFLAIIGICVACAIKINSAILLPILFLLLIIHSKQRNVAHRKTFLYGLTGLMMFIIITVLLSPYYTTIDFRNLFIYERDLLTGILPVFYTGEFFNTTPVIYQFFHIFPFLINPILTIIFIPSLIYQTHEGLKRKNLLNITLLIFFLTIFLPSSFLFAKWTRYVVPTLPLIYLMISIFLEAFLNKLKYIRNYVLGIIIFISIIFSVSYFITAFVNQDTRIEASHWTKNNISIVSPALGEAYDLGIIPFNSSFRNISLFNFYDLDPTSIDKTIQLKNLLSSSKTIILPSQRILKIRLVNQKNFPNGNNFYVSLISGRLGYQKVYETPCDIFCKITYLGSPVYSFEETASVFDRPTVFIFKKI
jgi:4-amino-4-deoxy-L-arabinose transferase-like glycosyltransferase